MTVHGNRPRCPEDRGSSRGRGPLLVNGERKIEGPMLENLSMSQSWNGYIWHLQQSPHEKKNQLTNGHNGLLQTYPVAGKPRTLDLGYSKRDSLVSRSRDSPVSVGSLDRPSSVDRLSNDRLSNDRLSSDRLSNDRLSSDRLSNDRLSNGSDRNRFATSYDDDSLTTASSNLDSSEQEEEYVTLDRSYNFSRSFKSQGLSHHSSMIDLKHNSLYSPKVNNDDAVNTRTLPHNRKFRGPLRSVSVNETDLDSVDINGKSIPWAKRSLKKIYENIGDILKPRTPTKSPPVVDILPFYSEHVGLSYEQSDTSSVQTDNTSNSGKTPKSNGRLRKRSKSLGELQLFGENNENELDSDSEHSDSESDSDVDGDDFGFLPMSILNSSSAMQKSKSTSAHHSLLPKRWRSKSRTSTSGQCLWSPEVSQVCL